MPPQPWTRAEIGARDSLRKMRENTAEGSISFDQFAGQLKQDYSWNTDTAERYAVGTARSEGNIGQRFLQRSGATKRAREKYRAHKF